MHALKHLPWRGLFIAAGMAVVSMRVFDWIAYQGLTAAGASSAIAKLLNTYSGSLLIFILGSLAVGGLGVLCSERWAPVGPIYVSTLWALVLCLLISIWVTDYLGFPGLGLVGISEGHAMGLIIGVFWRGHRYWRRWR